MHNRFLGAAFLVGALIPAAAGAQVGLYGPWNPYAGQVVLFPYEGSVRGGWCPRGWGVSELKPLPISEYEELFANVDTTWAETWEGQFFPPELRGQGPTPYCIALHGALRNASPYVPHIGQIALFAFTSCPSGWHDPAGQTLWIQEHAAPFMLIGNVYGGDGIQDFALPDLRNKGPRGYPWAVMDDKRLQYCIALEGAWPKTVDGRRVGPAPYRPFLGEIGLFANESCPPDWLDAAGQTLPISQHQALYSLLGAAYGGNGTTNFNLPDLREWAPNGSTLAETEGPRRVRYCIAIDGDFPPRS